MALYVILRPGNGFKFGDIVEDDADGMVQKVIIDRSGERSGYTGIMVPLSAIRHQTVKLLKRGLDFRKGGALG